MKTSVPERLKSRYRQWRAKLLSLGLSGTVSVTQPDAEKQASRDFSAIVTVRTTPPQVLARCLASLRRYGANAQVILVNDASDVQQNVASMVDAQRQLGWTLVTHDKPHGHSQACHAGAGRADREYLCLLNADTVLTPWSWAGARDAFESDPRIAVTGPSTSRAATRQRIKRADYCRRYWTDGQICAFARRYIARQTPGVVVDLPVISGFAFFIRRSVWQEARGFDPNLPDYGNESELCRRLTRDGFRLVWTPRSYIHHLGRQDYGRAMTPREMAARAAAVRAYIESVHGRKC